MEGEIDLLWTGGLDSTYRLIELSRRSCVVQPHYILDSRKSRNKELYAMYTILRLLRKNKNTYAVLRDPLLIEKESLVKDNDIFDSWMMLFPGKGTGSMQYYTLAKYAAHNNLHLEMGLQFSPNGTIVKAIDESLLIPHPDKDYDVLMIDHSRADQDTINVFGNFYFPKSLYHKKKKEEIAELYAMGYKTVVKHTWSCLKPIWGFPCGHCLPCRSSEIEGVKIPRIGKILYAITHLFEKHPTVD